MGTVIEIGICKSKGDEMVKVNKAEAVMGKGLVSDRKFKENNNKLSQLTLIEIENIDYYNKISRAFIHPLDFRRNIVTKNIKLNNLVNKEFFIGNVKLKAHDLCRPCKYLQNLLSLNNFVEVLSNKAGLRCEILCNGTISVDDQIKF